MTTTSAAVARTMACAAAVIAQFVAAKAARDTLFLTSLDVTMLPVMLMVTAACSLFVLVAHGRAAQRLPPRTLVPLLFTASGALFIAEWLCRPAAPEVIAVLVYLHVSVAGPLLTSAFWLIASETFNPRTAKKGYGRIAGAGTLGGLAGALLAERLAATVGVPSVLLILGFGQCALAWTIRNITPATQHTGAASMERGAATWTSGVRVVARAPYLRVLVALLLLGTTGAALLDYVFKVSAVESFGRGDNLLRFFALYYGATSLVSFLLQALASRAVLERFGLALTSSAPSIALIAGSVASLLLPGFGSLIIARGAESIFRTSWFRAGYELFYTPIPSDEKRSAKSLIDVGVERVGDGLGGALVWLIALLVPVAPSSAMVLAAVVSSIGAIVAAAHLNRWYVRSLERSLMTRGRAVGPSDPRDDATAHVLLRVRRARAAAATVTGGPHTLTGTAAALDPSSGALPASALVEDIRILQSTGTQAMKRIRRVLSRDEGLAAATVAHAIPLLRIDDVADFAIFALRKVAEERVGLLSDALLDPGQDDVIRRRLAQVFSVCVSQRAADCLLLALDDARLDVRAQAARSLVAITDRNPGIRIDRDRIYAVILREVSAGRPVWESRRIIEASGSATPLDAILRERAGQSLAHVFTLLSLVLPREPVQIAFRSLTGEDKHLRGTALEYLESVLPPAVRPHLWRHLVYQPATAASGRDGAIVDLLRSSESRTVQGMAEAWQQQSVAGFPAV